MDNIHERNEIMWNIRSSLLRGLGWGGAIMFALCLILIVGLGFIEVYRRNPVFGVFLIWGLWGFWYVWSRPSKLPYTPIRDSALRAGKPEYLNGPPYPRKGTP
jgi:hypothetical protein